MAYNSFTTKTPDKHLQTAFQIFDDNDVHQVVNDINACPLPADSPSEKYRVSVLKLAAACYVINSDTFKNLVLSKHCTLVFGNNALVSDEEKPALDAMISRIVAFLDAAVPYIVQNAHKLPADDAEYLMPFFEFEDERNEENGNVQ